MAEHHDSAQQEQPTEQVTSYEPVSSVAAEDLQITAAVGEEQTLQVDSWPYTPKSGQEAAFLASHPLVKEQGAEDPSALGGSFASGAEGASQLPTYGDPENPASEGSAAEEAPPEPTPPPEGAPPAPHGGSAPANTQATAGGAEQTTREES